MKNYYRSTSATGTATAITKSLPGTIRRHFCERQQTGNAGVHRFRVIARVSRDSLFRKPFEFCFSIIFALALSTPLHADVGGDPGAIDLADRMLESIGGKELWSKIRTLYVVEKSRSEKGDGIIGEFWRDLQYPREAYTLNNRRDIVIRTWWNKQGFWQTLNGQVNHRLNPKLHQDALDYWHGEIYVMYHRLARGDDSLSLAKVDNRAFSVFDEILKRELGTFWVNDDGELYRWRHEDGTEYIYGPHRSFGDISFPDWGTNVDGTWSFYYTEVRWSPDEPPVSFEAPR